MKYLTLALLPVAAMSVHAVSAQDTPDDTIEEMVVVAHPLSGEGLSQSVEVLQGEELEQKLAGNIGATLAQEPGIHSANFGNSVGRPVIHGLGGPRVRIMEDRIDALDVSVTSADHAVTIEPFIAERIEVLKGPSALLYGSGAIGGVVDVHTARIPHVVPQERVSGGIETRFDSNTQGNTTAAKINGGSGKFAWHFDGTIKDGDDYDIPGFAESARLRALEEAESGGGEEEEEEEAFGTLPGSAFDSSSYAGGLSYIADWGFIGASLGELDANYGLPGGHGHEEEEEDPAEIELTDTPTLDMEQTRVDFELGVKQPFKQVDSLNVRLGVNDYAHVEIEPNGEIATSITNKAWELRTELVYSAGVWNGAVGLQHTDREFSAIGEEAFVPPVDTKDSGLFWVTEREFERFSLETGLRLGRVEHSTSSGPDRDFSTYAASLGLVIPWSDRLQIGVTSDLSTRAPVSEELYSNGPHLVTGSFELGDTELDREQALSLAATLQYRSATWSATATAYYTDFSDFIYERATGAVLDELPVFQFQQDDATFAGIDTQITRNFALWNTSNLELRGLFDVVNAQLDVSGNDNLPRIPPLRFGLGAELSHGALSASLDYYRTTEQDDVAEQELVTDAYDDLRAYISYDFNLPRGTLNLFLAGKNLTDDEQRSHTSFIKEFAPAPGRSVELGVRYLFAID